MHFRALALLSLTAIVVCHAATALAERPEEGPGIQVRGSHIEGQGIPQVQSITPVELFPYWLMDNSLFFSDLRAYTTNDLFYGGNAGIGYRYYHSEWERTFGISGWYDGDNARDVYLQQAGLSLETYGWLFDLRANGYLPVGTTDRLSSLTAIDGTTQFSGQYLAYDLVRTSYVAMRGLDYELGVPLPTDFAERHGLRVYGGGYYFEDDDNNKINGWSGRFVANIVDGLDAQVQVTHDDYYNTRAFVGVSWTLGYLHPSKQQCWTGFGRIGEHVTRNYTVLAPSRTSVERLIAVDPANGTPYTFAHISSAAAPGGTGGSSDPFQNIAAAQAAGRDIMFVHAGSVINGAGPIVLAAGERLLGDSSTIQHFVQVPEIGPLLLPHGPTSGALPRITNSLGDAVVLANQSEIAGFAISGASGHGIAANGVQSSIVRQVAIDQVGGNGLNFVNTAGAFSLANVSISNTAGSGVALHGGSAVTEFLTPLTVSGAGGPAVSLRDLSSAASVKFSNLTINNRQDRGVEIENVAGAVSVSDRLTIANQAGSTASALDIGNSSGKFDIARLDVTAATGAPGVNIENNTGTTRFGALNISSNNATALRAVNGGALTVNEAVKGVVNPNGGVINAVGGTAVDLQNTILNFNLTSVSASNAVRGMSLVDTTGTFVILGTGAAGSGGILTNNATGIFLQNASQITVQYMTLDANGVGVQSIGSADVSIALSTIKNSTSFGIDALNTTKLQVVNSTLSGNGATNLRAQFDKVGEYAYTLSESNFSSATSDNVVLVVLNGGAGSTMNFAALGGDITNSLAGTTGIKVDWNGTLSANVNDVTFTAVGGSNVGAAIHNTGSAAFSGISFNLSGFKGTGGNDTALEIATAGASQIAVGSNSIEFNGTQNTGMKLALGPSAAVSISSNHIFDTSDGTTGVLFDSVAGPASIVINNNFIDLKDQGALLDRGIVLQNIATTATLSGNVNNTVNNADTPFFAPVGRTTGVIYVNGAAVP